MEDTYTLLRKYDGGPNGPTVTDGKHNYRYSDRSDSRRMCFGWRLKRDGQLGAYGALPRLTKLVRP